MANITDISRHLHFTIYNGVANTFHVISTKLIQDFVSGNIGLKDIEEHETLIKEIVND